MLGIDSNIYSSSTDSNVTYHTNGAVRPETLEWIRQQLAVARAGGKRVIAMMHHHLVEHIDGEAQLLPNYIVARRNDVAQVLREGGVKVVFTGHLHITDAATQDGITDVSTGSASTYPIAMRTATIDPSLTAMSIETKILENLGSCSLDKGRSKIENSAPVLAGIVSRRLWSRMEPRLKQYEPLLAEQGVDTSRLPRKAGDVAALITRHLSQPLAQSLMMVARGGEDPAQAPAIVEAVKQGVRGMVADVFTEGADDVADFLIENLMPRAQVLMRSALEDINQVGTSEQSTTHDHSLTVKL